MTSTDPSSAPFDVVTAGRGVAALEAALALRELAPFLDERDRVRGQAA
jgi:hypothetical protein